LNLTQVPIRIDGEAEFKEIPLPLITAPKDPVRGGRFSDVFEISKKAVTVAFGLLDTRFPMDTITFELI
jgi:hypothetical protein